MKHCCTGELVIKIIDLGKMRLIIDLSVESVTRPSLVGHACFSRVLVMPFFGVFIVLFLDGFAEIHAAVQ